MKHLFIIFFLSLINAVHSADDIMKHEELFRSVIQGNGPSCFISFARTGENEEYIRLITRINQKLQRLRIKTYFDMNPHIKRGLQVGEKISDFIENIKTTRFVVSFLTQAYVKQYKEENSGVHKECLLIHDRLSDNSSDSDSNHFFISIALDTSIKDSVPLAFRERLCDTDHGLHENNILKSIMQKMYLVHLKRFFDKADRSTLETAFFGFFELHSSLDTNYIGSQPVHIMSPQQILPSPQIVIESQDEILSEKTESLLILDDYEDDMGRRRLRSDEYISADEEG